MGFSKTCAFATLGCKVNQYDTEALIALFRKHGYEVVDFDSKADVYCINTCTVTSTSDHKSRQLIRRARRRNPDAIIVVTGCYPQVSPEEVASIPGVNVVTGTHGRSRIIDLVEEAKEKKDGAIVAVEPVSSRGEFEETPVEALTRRARAYVKIQEGCDQFCAYCRVPFARGPVRSRKPEDVISEVERLLLAGYREIVLTGIHLGLYGADLAGADRARAGGEGTRPDGVSSLAEITRRLLDIGGEWRLRLSSIEPMDITGELISTIASSPRAARHLHIPLQSGDPDILRLMGRPYSPDDYARLVEDIRRTIPGCAITTDVMVGFPQETDERFERSYRFVEGIGFSRLHVFRFSRRPGTRAFYLSGQVDARTSARRSRAMVALGDKLSLAFHEGMTGKDFVVLFEESHPGGIPGDRQRSCKDPGCSPAGHGHLSGGCMAEGLTDTYVRTYVAGDGELVGSFRRVRITGAASRYVVGRLD
ncbi:MAG TPA: tRNA (N(6)-L-threonylcarbamoyladenosine(37)-C(2))-methylthiotransferase MtaB [Firmicutes bacterium]|nr:tRNA (N(6)-L-threonylcarbamoyladenosine(37)-C(2))-methylthiotransferase MtaB [Bacillota bacterium]